VGLWLEAVLSIRAPVNLSLSRLLLQVLLQKCVKVLRRQVRNMVFPGSERKPSIEFELLLVKNRDPCSIVVGFLSYYSVAIMLELQFLSPRVKNPVHPNGALVRVACSGELQIDGS